jgi:hypothetical protein
MVVLQLGHFTTCVTIGGFLLCVFGRIFRGAI